MMEKKEQGNFKNEQGSIPQGVPVASTSGSGAMNLDYFREARLFLSKDRATLTFYVHQEVASIHYDLHRDEIFYRGHNVKNMTMSQEQWDYLQKFSDYLAQDPKAEHLQRAYRSCLEHLMTDHGLPV